MGRAFSVWIADYPEQVSAVHTVLSLRSLGAPEQLDRLFGRFWHHLLGVSLRLVRKYNSFKISVADGRLSTLLQLTVKRRSKFTSGCSVDWF